MPARRSGAACCSLTLGTLITAVSSLATPFWPFLPNRCLSRATLNEVFMRATKPLDTRRTSRTVRLLAGLLVIGLFVAARPSKPQADKPPTVHRGLRLYVMDGGIIIIDAPEKFGLTREQVKNSNMSCPVYLIVHPRGTLLFDTGLGDRYFGHPFNENLLGDPPTPAPFQSFVLVTKTLRSQLEGIEYPPSKITYLAMSHPHVD